MSHKSKSLSKTIRSEEFSNIKYRCLRGQDSKYFIEKIDIILEAIITIYKVYSNNQELEFISLNFYYDRRIVRLTSKQLVCLTHLAMGRSNKRIANLLGCSLSNVEDHICRLKQKTGLYTTDALIDFFWKKYLDDLKCDPKLGAG